jgi:hypothetical protein
MLCLMLAANALVQPYRGLFHDARLYAAQVTKRLSPGSFDQDLYLRYGSQDRFTVFTPLMAPIVSLAGLEASFYLVYLACKVLFFWSLLRLVFALVPEPAPALLALFYLAIAPLPFGGNEIFHLNEPFLTPRIPASALVLLAIERALAGRMGLAVLCLTGSMLLHPLMALGGVLVVLIWWLMTRLRPRNLAILAGVVGLAGIVAVVHEPLG